MREYGRVSSNFWEAAHDRGLSDQAKLLAVYLLTGPHTTLLGCFRLPDGYVADDLGWNLETVSTRFGELIEKGFIKRDAFSKWVLYCGFLATNRIENPNQATAAAKLYRQLPQGELSVLTLDEIGKHAPRYLAKISGCQSEGDQQFRNSSEAVSRTFANQKQEQEQDKSPSQVGSEVGEVCDRPHSPNQSYESVKRRIVVVQG